MKYIAYLILLSTIIFNLYINFPETQILADPNDNIFQYSLVSRTNWVWENYGCPLSPSCIPNLTDHNVTTWAEGYPLPFYYSHIPQIAIVSSYNLIIKPITSLFTLRFSLFAYYNWTKYLLLTLFPIPIFFALRIIGFSPFVATLGAFFGSNFSTDGLYGIDPPSFLWRGYGLTSQLYAIFFMPLGLAFTYRALSNVSFWQVSETNASRIKKGFWSRLAPQNDNYWLYAAIFLTLTTAGHLGLGIIGILSTTPFIFIDLDKKNILQRGKKLFFIYIFLLIVLSYWIIPVLLKTSYHMISFWDPIWKFYSYGWQETVRQLFQGEIFDWQRTFPVITFITLTGLFVALTDVKLFCFAILFVFMFLFYFGHTTWGRLLDIIPGLKDFHQHRFIVGIHIAALFLIPSGIQFFIKLIGRFTKFSLIIISNFKNQILNTQSKNQKVIFQTIIFHILSLTFISFIIYFTVQQTIKYASFNNRWIGEANNAYKYDEKNFQDMASFLKTLSSGRIYAGRPGNWGHDFRLGSTQMYMLLGVNGFDISQFLPETWSPLSENEQNFDERVAQDYDLLNIRYIASFKNQGFTDKAKMVKKFGPFELYEVPTTGWFDVVTSPMMVIADKTNFINIVSYWHKSYARGWNMHPLISVEKRPEIPDGMQKVIKMTDEVTYQVIPSERSESRDPIEMLKQVQHDRMNIFNDYPFVFPEATISGKIVKENITRQTYSAVVEVPRNCKNCYVMFKMSYHPDWEAKLDGQKVQKFAVFPFYLAAQITPGTHMVEFTYSPNRLKVVLLILEIIGLISLLIYFQRNFLTHILRKIH